MKQIVKYYRIENICFIKMFASFNIWTYLCYNNFAIWDFADRLLSKIKLAVVKLPSLKCDSENGENITTVIISYST